MPHASEQSPKAADSRQVCVSCTHATVWGALCGAEVTGWRPWVIEWVGCVFLPWTHGTSRCAVRGVFCEVRLSVSQDERRVLSRPPGPDSLFFVQLERLDCLLYLKARRISAGAGQKTEGCSHQPKKKSETIRESEVQIKVMQAGQNSNFNVFY